MFGTTWKDSFRKLGKLFEQLHLKRKILFQKYFAQYVSLIVIILALWKTGSVLPRYM